MKKAVRIFCILIAALLAAACIAFALPAQRPVRDTAQITNGLYQLVKTENGYEALPCKRQSTVHRWPGGAGHCTLRPR